MGGGGRDSSSGGASGGDDVAAAGHAAAHDQPAPLLGVWGRRATRVQRVRHGPRRVLRLRVRAGKYDQQLASRGGRVRPGPQAAI